MRIGTPPSGPPILCPVEQIPCLRKKFPASGEARKWLHKPLIPPGDRLPKPPQEAAIGRNLQNFPVNFPVLSSPPGLPDLQGHSCGARLCGGSCARAHHSGAERS